MLPGLALIFAQLITLGVGDRTEARYLRIEDKRWEATTTPSVSLDTSWPRGDLNLLYAPSLLITPLDRAPRHRLVLHSISLSIGYRLEQHTRLSLISSLRFGQVNFRSAVLDGSTASTATSSQPQPATGSGDTANSPATQPTPTGSSTAGGTPSDAPTTQPQVRVVDRIVRHLVSTTTLALSHEASRSVSVGAYASYIVTGGMNAAAQRDYPLTRGWVLGASSTATNRLGARDDMITDVFGQLLWSSNDNEVSVVQATESWRHRLRPRTQSNLAAGLNISRAVRNDGLVAISIFPNFLAGIEDQERLARGQLVLGLNAYSTPVLDPVRATIDPRLGVRGTATWSRDKFLANLMGSATVSVAPKGNDASSYDSYDGVFTMSYAFNRLLALDAGARGTEQRFRGATLVAPSWTVFAGVTVGDSFSIKGGR